MPKEGEICARTGCENKADFAFFFGEVDFFVCKDHFNLALKEISKIYVSMETYLYWQKSPKTLRHRTP